MLEGYVEFYGHAPDLLVVTMNHISMAVSVLPVIEHLGTTADHSAIHPSLFPVAFCFVINSRGWLE